MSNLVLRANLSRPLTHNELDANMQFLEIVEWSAKEFRAGQFAYVTVTGTTTLYLCLETHTGFVYDNNGGDFAETITIEGTPVTLWRKISGSGGGTGAEFVNASFNSGTNILTFTAADSSTVTVDLSSLAGGGTGSSGTSGNSGTSGITGSSGSSGSAGSSGTSGVGSPGSSGSSGNSGTSGITGSSGSSGNSGTNGVSGSSGSSGETGTSGANGDLYKTTSSTPYVLGSPGMITVGTGLAYTVAQSIIIAYDINNYQECEVINYDGTSGILTFGVPTRVVGAGSHSSWVVNLDGASGGDGTSGSAGSSGSSGFTGSSGTSGFTGSSGSSGAQGTSGTAGGDGTSGTDGGGGTSGTAGVSDKYLGTVAAPIDYSSLSIPIPLVVITSVNLSYSPGESVVVAYDISNYAEGRVITYNPATGQLAITLTNIVFATSGGLTPSTSNLQGTIGATGSSGSSGASGTSGGPGTSGSAGSSGESGTSGVGSPGSSGSAGSSGAAGVAGTSGTSSAGGGTSTVYNNVSRYLAYNSGSANIYMVSSATVNTGLSWSRSGSTVTITHNNHGRSNGEAVIIRNVNIDNEYCIISNASTNTFDITVSSSSGASSGSAAAYSLGFTVSSVTAAGATIVAPSGGDVQLMSYYHATGSRSGTTYALTTPISATNGGGANSAANNAYFPIIRVQDVVSGTIVGASMTLATASNYHVFNLGSLGASNSNAIRMVF
jgi:hypothetical protein